MGHESLSEMIARMLDCGELEVAAQLNSMRAKIDELTVSNTRMRRRLEELEWDE